MRCNRPLLLTALLTVYLGRVMCGEALHLVQCSADHASCSSIHNHSNTQQAQDCSHDCCLDDAVTENPDQEPADQNSQHDSKNCSVCQVLGQAQIQAILIELPTSAEAVPATITANPVLYLPLARTCIQPRAPPVVV